MKQVHGTKHIVFAVVFSFFCSFSGIIMGVFRIKHAIVFPKSCILDVWQGFEQLSVTSCSLLALVRTSYLKIYQYQSNTNSTWQVVFQNLDKLLEYFCSGVPILQNKVHELLLKYKNLQKYVPRILQIDFRKYWLREINRKCWKIHRLWFQ